MLKLEHDTLNDLTYRAIKQELISGSFVPGQILVIRQLAQAFGTSTTPIREALQRLVAERILELQRNRSIAIPVLSAATFKELVRIRCAVEGLATEMAAKSISADELASLKGLSESMDASLSPSRSRRYLTLNEKFHFTIYDAAGAPILLDMIRNLWGRIGPYLNYLFEVEPYVPHANDNHWQVIAALEKRAAKAARNAIVCDISDAASAMTKKLPSDGSGRIRSR
jgi:DNA-binding GntR family transcriptional regulator